MYGRAMRSTILALGLVAAGAAMAQPGQGYGRGPGYGPGMMGGGGYGPGGGIAALDLTPEQQQKVLAIQEENRRKNWDTMGKMRAEQFRLRSLYNADDVDAKAYAEQQRKLDDLRREMMVSRFETRKQIEGVLTPEQRQQFRQFGPRWLEDTEVD